MMHSSTGPANATSEHFVVQTPLEALRLPWCGLPWLHWFHRDVAEKWRNKKWPRMMFCHKIFYIILSFWRPKCWFGLIYDFSHFPLWTATRVKMRTEQCRWRALLLICFSKHCLGSAVGRILNHVTGSHVAVQIWKMTPRSVAVPRFVKVKACESNEPQWECFFL